jgi:hypothetical protein
MTPKGMPLVVGSQWVLLTPPFMRWLRNGNEMVKTYNKYALPLPALLHLKSLYGIII